MPRHAAAYLRSWLGMLLVVLAAATTAAASEPPFVADPVAWSRPAISTALPLQMPARAYLATVVVDGPLATIRFGTGLVDGGLTGEGTTFAFGLRRLSYLVAVAGGAGKPFREEWTVDGLRRPELDRSGIVPAANSTLSSAIALSTGNPLPRGTYRLRFVVGAIAGEAQARIE